VDPQGLEELLGVERVEEIRVVSYRRGRRAVARVLASAQQGRATHYLKLLRSRDLVRAIPVFRALGEAASPALLLPDAIDRESSVLAFQELTGRSLHERVWSGDMAPAALLQGLAHQMEKALPRVAASNGQLPTYDLEGYRAATISRLQAGARVRPRLATLAHRIAHAPMGRASLDLAASPVGIVHGDLHDKQIFESGGEAVLIDNEGCGCGPLWIDQVNLTEHLALRGMQGASCGAAAAEQARQAFGLDVESPAIAALRTLTQARLAAVYALRPWWWSLSQDLEASAHAALNRSG